MTESVIFMRTEGNETIVWKPRTRSTGLVDQLQSSHRFTVRVLVSVLLLSLVTSGYLILVSQPRLATYVDLTREARDAHEAMLDQETGLRGWLATGDPVFLAPYRAAKVAADTSVDSLVADVRSSPDVMAPVVDMLLAREKWQQWASRAVATRITGRQRIDGTLSRLLLEGKALFDRYRAADSTSTDLIRGRRNLALSRQNTALVGVLTCYLVLLGAAGAATLRCPRLDTKVERRHVGEYSTGRDERLPEGQMTNESEPDATRRYRPPAIVSRESIEALAVDSSLSDSKPIRC